MTRIGTTLIERLTAAKGADREIDERIWCEINGEEWHATEYLESPRGRVIRRGYQNIPAYTASLDAAMTLVPEGAQWTLEADAAWVRVLTADDVAEFQGNFCRREGRCTAIALCIAALKARMA